MWKRIGYKEQYLPEILAMTREHYGDENDIAQADYLHHQYFGNPNGDAVIELAVDPENGALAGQYIVCPMCFQVSGARVRCTNSLNTLTREAYRGQGIFTGLAEAIYQSAAEQGYRFCYGMPNPNSYPGFLKKLGFTELGRVPLMLKPLKPSQMVREYLHSGALSQAAKMFDPLFRIGKEAPSVQVVPVTPERVNDMDRFWEGVKGKYPVMNVLDGAFVRYRFLEMPHRTYHPYLALEDGAPVCFAATRMTEVAGMKCAMLAEFLFWNGHEKAAEELLIRVLREMQQLGAGMAGCLMLGHTQEAKLLKKHGFFKCPRKLEPQPFPLIFRAFDGCPETAVLMDLKNWFFTMGDYDAI